MVVWAFTIALGANPAIGDSSDGLLLRRILRSGSKEVYESRWKSERVLTLGVQPEPEPLRSGVTRYEVEFGARSMTGDSIRVSISAPTEQNGSSVRNLAIDPNSATATMDLRGQIVYSPRKITGVLAAQGNGPLLPLPALPTGKVKVGDEWTFFAQQDDFTGNQPQFGTARLIRVEQGPFGRRAKVHYRITINANADLTNPDVKAADGKPFTVRLVGPMDYVGSAWIDVATGRVTGASVTGLYTLYVDLPTIRSRSGTTTRTYMEIRLMESEPRHK